VITRRHGAERYIKSSPEQFFIPRGNFVPHID
jgi:hypothetical protein